MSRRLGRRLGQRSKPPISRDAGSPRVEASRVSQPGGWDRHLLATELVSCPRRFHHVLGPDVRPLQRAPQYALRRLSCNRRTRTTAMFLVAFDVHRLCTLLPRGLVDGALHLRNGAFCLALAFVYLATALQLPVAGESALSPLDLSSDVVDE